MARKERNNVDYFPHPVSHGKKMFYLRTKFKNNGYSVWFMLLEQLGKADYHYLDLNDSIQIMYLSSELMVEENILNDIIETLVQFEEFDKELWENESILFNEKFVENISDAYKKRNNKCIDKNSLIEMLTIKGRIKPPKGDPKPPKKKLKAPVKPQSIVEKTIEEESKVKTPSLEEFKNYALENCKDINIESVELKYKAWVENDWKDGKDKKIKNWKTKLLNTLTYLPKNGKEGFQKNSGSNAGSKETILPSSDLSTEWTKD